MNRGDDKTHRAALARAGRAHRGPRLRGEVRGLELRGDAAHGVRAEDELHPHPSGRDHPAIQQLRGEAEQDRGVVKASPQRNGDAHGFAEVVDRARRHGQFQDLRVREARVACSGGHGGGHVEQGRPAKLP